MEDHVFICYSRKDVDFVLKLATNLKNHEVPVWLDQWDIPSGANWNRTIERALKECARLLIVLTPSSVDSDEVQSEWLSALDEKKVIVPILYQKCKMPFRLKPIQYIDFTSRSPDDKTALKDVLVALGIPAPEDPPLARRSHYGKGLAFLNEGKIEKALGEFEEAIRLDPDDIESWKEKAKILIGLGQNYEADDAKAKVRELNAAEQVKKQSIWKI
jgi:tetratricopeptide (TPR) repeat protein